MPQCDNEKIQLLKYIIFTFYNVNIQAFLIFKYFRIAILLFNKLKYISTH